MLVIYEKEDNIWKNEVWKQIPKTAQNIGIQGRLPNYSIHKTCISRPQC